MTTSTLADQAHKTDNTAPGFMMSVVIERGHPDGHGDG